MIKEENQPESKTDKSNDKAPYHSPQLTPYGDILELTLLSVGKGMLDGGGGGGQKTA
jgi:hypothetical protein